MLYGVITARNVYRKKEYSLGNLPESYTAEVGRASSQTLAA